MNKQVVTRIAPSPTGKFHIGTARTALFNYLFARCHGGKFFLRIEDTDQARSSVEHIEDIKDSLDWLELDWDNRNSEHYQSKRLQHYQQAAQKLVEAKLAYEKDAAIYFSVEKGAALIESSPYIKNGDTIIFSDLVHGNIETAVKDIKDFVILKADGWPTFHLAVTVDDHDMGITHVIRGDDHLSNTPKHILLYEALGLNVPEFGHLPLILNKDRSKMSKRQDPVSVTEDFRKKGYLSDALINFLALLGWNPKNEKEYFTLVQLVEIFSIDNVQKSNAVFNVEKLNHFNEYYLRKMPPKELVEQVRPMWAKQFDISQFPQWYLEKVCALIVDRAITVNDLTQGVGYFFTAPKLNRDDLVFKRSDKEKTLNGLNSAMDVLGAIDEKNWSPEHLLQALGNIVEKTGLNNGDIFWPVRYALSGENASPKPEELLSVLGKEKSIKRIEMAAQLLK